MDSESHERMWALVIRWLARGTSLISIGLLSLFVFGERGTQPITTRQWVGLLFFPIGVVIGMVIAWWREPLGASISLASLACFYLIFGLALTGSFPGGWYFAAFTSPALLFLMTWLIERAARHGAYESQMN